MKVERTDEELLLLFKEGSRDAFEELFARHHRRVINFCFRMTGDQARAEEAAQEIFLRIARAAFTYQPTAKFTTWLYQIARRTTLNFLRDDEDGFDKTFLPVGEENDDGTMAVPLPGPATLEPERMAWSAQVRDRLLAALQAIPESYRSPLLLCAAEGLSYEEAAAVLGVTVQTVKSRVFRARRMLLAQLKEEPG